MIVVSDDGFLDVLAKNLDVLQMRRDDEFLLVGAFLDKDDLVVVHECPANLDGLTDGAELPSAVACYDDGVRIVVTFAAGKRREK